MENPGKKKDTSITHPPTIVHWTFLVAI